jgi:hypothetical protein
MNNHNFTNINDIMKHLTEYLYKHGYIVEMECIRTFEAGESHNAEHHQDYNEIEKWK